MRKSIHKHALESKLLNLIGHAEFKKEVQKTVDKISQDTTDMEINTDTRFELDENELKRYLDIVIREVKKEKDLLFRRVIAKSEWNEYHIQAIDYRLDFYYHMI